ncbi:OLC1v1000034C2 [Oldenlandia corymbosa var. corymbosa]|uniref:OLC1v1000034C2 n=1 Tax=Oldenlandia corymbosa var. corymbosa TaxID=529605 RepID=A0AAV1D3F4_OLDCO|nr:OLC1v1000034C2 [Oldenlandia corymbosa var. corymbosa]
MAKILLLGRPYFNRLFSFFIAFSIGVHCFLYGQVQAAGSDDVGGDVLNNTYTISSSSYPETRLNPYDWRYIRVNLPPWFSSMTINLESDVDLDLRSIGKAPRSTLPMICFREGSPPLPDVHNTSITGLVLKKVSNGTFGGTNGLQTVEECYPMQKTLSVRLTNEQISPGVWYFGLFNGIGPMRTQSKMINRGQSYSFHGNVTVEGCIAPMVSGQFCNKTVDLLSCIDSPNLIQGSFDNHTSDNTAEYAVICRNPDNSTCTSDTGPKIFSLNLVGFSEELILKVSNITVKSSKNSNGTITASDIIFTCYARHGAMPLDTLHDYYGNITEAPLIISRPKVGRWYVSVQPVNLPIGEVCYSLEWQVLQCPVDKAGPNCTWKSYMLQTVKNNGGTFESYYLPITKTVAFDSANFPIEPLLSNSSGGNSDVAWTYFLVDVPFGAAGGNIHFHTASDDKIDYEIYARYAGFPSLENWDYYCTNSTSSSNDSMFFKLYDATEKSMSFYILYPREGTWSLGLKHLASAGTKSMSRTTMSISMESCPEKCSSHGTCKFALDTSGLTLYSYCACDRDHGGFDCSIELVSHSGHLWQSISLIASNAAAVLPAYWALRHKAFAEWVLYTSSGISSGLYHACDVGTWCPLTFHVLQFMDFWLSFMAVVSTFVYLASIDETSKRTIHTVVAIVTALMAETGPTRSSNIVLVLAIGIVGLVVGWLIELSTHYRSISWSWSWPVEFHLNMADSWRTMREWMQNLIRTLLKRFRWGFVIGGFCALALAAISWALETSKTYWIWHSVWHISIYTSSFLFLCSKAKVVNCVDERTSDGNYVLTRQNSQPRDDQRDDR